MIEKNYQPAEIEPRIREAWDAAEAFKAGRPERREAEPFTIVIPPPNVTGSLHMGHALNNTLQDILCRFERMRGRDVLWQPGTDHAGIATQMVVERQLAARKEPTRREMGREAFLDRVWQWKAESGDTIVNQLKRLGASCDWSRERFTMDEGLSRAVAKVFCALYAEGLIYKDKRLVNWDPKLLTAISDLEVQQVEVKGHLWHLRYPYEDKTFNPDDPSTYIVVATTRPETMLGDSAVAVNPADDRYRNVVGLNVVLPLVGRRIPIVADDYSDPEKGSGAVKITPAHDFNDFEVGKRHKLPQINILDIEGRLALADNDDYRKDIEQSGLDLIAELHGVERFAARREIVARLDQHGYLEKIEPNTHMVPHGDRSGVVIEPFLTDQWYVDAKTLAAPAIAAVRNGETSFVPKNWEKTYFEWMENIQPWCISRQLWWGHQIPAWYGPDGKVFVAETEEEAVGKALAYYLEEGVIDDDQAHDMAVDAAKRDEFITRDEDVLDTWFSSALWPFSTLGWPDTDKDVKRYYPTSVLVTGFDIIFFWVARMMMMGLHFMEEEPFHTVYVHALVRDKNGAKMSKSKGNVIDPLELIDEYGADALRFTLAIMAAQGRDVKLDPARIAGYRNFGTKLWNATRFAEMNGARHDPAFSPAQAKLTLNRWILTELSRTVRSVTDAIETYRFNEAAGAAYRFVWNLFCDWYLELLKPVFAGEDEAAKQESQATAAYVLDEIYKLLHPMMPFMTEELWSRTAGEGNERLTLLCHAEWPRPGFEDAEAAAEVNWLVDLVSGIRSVRSEMNVPPSAIAPMVVVGADATTRERIGRHDPAIRRLARVGEVGFAGEAPRGAAQLVLGEATFCLPLGTLIDLSAESARLSREIVKMADEIGRIDKKLSNEKFVANAPDEIVEAEREKRAEFAEQKTRLETALARVKDAV
ncbi:MAG TPA: valine--tRNA ligase [Rhizobiaceae bacterium]|nr:valine--tRNA ligase [Rhizobiaceae bacterium]